MDPQQRLVLKGCWRALEHASISSPQIKGTNTGVFVGVSNTDYAHAMLKQGDVEKVNAYSATGNALNVISGRVSYFFDLHGPSMAIDTACSSSLVALHNACSSLRLNECNIAICSGVNVILLPEGNIALSQANMLSVDGKCYTFDERANGYVRSEGCISFILKRQQDAIKDGDKIYGLIKSSAVNHGGKSSGLTVPNAKAQENLIRQTITAANLEPKDISYIEAHGTGTALGDPIEVSALNEVFKKSHLDDKPLLIGSVKSNFGHLESASGLLGLLKVILAMQHEMIPANNNFSKLNSMIDLSIVPAKIVTKNTLWPDKQIAGISSFGFSGINAHIIVSKPETIKNESEELLSRTSEILCCSAKDEAALKIEIEELRQYLLLNNHSLATIAYNYNVFRSHFSFRQTFVSQAKDDLVYKLKDFKLKASSVNITKRKKIAFLISGQGSQYAGMGKSLYETLPLFKKWIDFGCEKINSLMNISLQEIIFVDPDKLINQTIYTQPILYIFNYALVKLWQHWGIEAECFVGHSIGEYIAATLAGVMSFDDGLLLVFERAKLMQNLEQGGSMMLVMASKENLDSILKQSSLHIDIAIITNDYTVLSGKKTDLDEFANTLSFHTKKLDVAHAFHSSLMEPILDKFLKVASRVNYMPPSHDVISNVTGEFYTKSTVNAQYWVKHLREAVDLRKAMAVLAQQKYDVLLEIGPRPTFSRSSTQFDNLLWVYSLRREADPWQSLFMNLAKVYELGIKINWHNVHVGFADKKIDIPGYPFQEKNYWGLVAEDEKPKLNQLENYLYQIENLPQEIDMKSIEAVNDATLLFTNDQTLIDLIKPFFKELHVSCDLEKLSKIIASHSIKNIIFFIKHETDELPIEIKRQYEPFLAIIKSLQPIQVKDLKLCLVTNNVNQKQNIAALSQAPLLGLRKCLLLESSNIDCIHITMNLDRWDKSQVEKLVSELVNSNVEKQIIYENDERFVSRLKRYILNKAHQKSNIVNSEGTYLITGGQGALASEVISWYLANGANNLILLSRRDPTQKTQQLVELAAKQGSKIECLAIDVSDLKLLKNLFAEFGKTKPKLNGIIHAAGVLDDGLIQNQTWQRFLPLLKSKIIGAWNLHQLSLKHNLEHFVMFSSVASVFGTHGQSNYAAANSFLDNLATFRRKQGLCSLSINWGPWANIGMAKDIKPRVDGLAKLSPKVAMELFDVLMKQDSPEQILVIDIKWNNTFAQHGMKLVFLENFWRESKLPQHTKSPDLLDLNSLSLLESSALKEYFLALLQDQLKLILQLDRDILPTQNFFEQGMDSLMAIELRNNLQVVFGDNINLSQTILFELSTLQELAEYLVNLVLNQQELSVDNVFLSNEEKLLSNIDSMDESDIDKLLMDISNDTSK